MAAPRLSLPHDLFMSAFPFHVAFDSTLRIVQAGHVLRRLCPDVTDGGPLQESFRIKRPNIQASFKGIQEHADSLFILESLSNGMVLRGQMLPDAGQGVIMFLCSPWLKDLSFAEDMGLSLSDFAIHDPVADFLFLLKTKDTALADVNSLAEKLKLQRGELRKTHDELEHLVQERTAALTTANAEILERRRAEAELERALEREREVARHDALTGVLSHGAITQVLREQCASALDEPVAVAMIDIDGMKTTNDTYGHQIGDQVLVTVAKALSRDEAIVGRYGGDEFVAVLPGTDRAAAERYREEVNAELQGAEIADPESGARIPVITSIGLAIFPEEAATVVDLMRLSDSAMYACKRRRFISDGGGTDGRVEDERAALMVGQIVPLLTAPGDINERLGNAARRLSVAAGYDAVDFVLFADTPGTPIAHNAFTNANEEFLNAWTREQRRDGSDPNPMRLLLERERRPVVLGDIEHDDRVTDSQRQLLIGAGIRSGLVVPLVWRTQVIGSLAVGSKQLAALGPADAQFLTAVAAQATAIIRTESLVEELRSASTQLEHAQTETVMLLAAAAEAHDRTTGLHLQGVRNLAGTLARELGSTEEEAEALGLASVLHDIGKVRVPDSILASPGQLTGERWDVMKQHTSWGAKFLAGHAGFELATAIALHHHEQWDGSGYPQGLSGNDIPEPALVVAVADAFDAITHDRPYRAGRTPEEAVKEISRFAGTQFSPKVVAALTRLHAEGLLPAAQGNTKLAAA